MGVGAQAAGEKQVAWLSATLLVDGSPAQIVRVHVDVEKPGGDIQPAHVDYVGGVSHRDVGFHTGDLAVADADVRGAVEIVGRIDDVTALQKQVERGGMGSHNNLSLREISGGRQAGR